MTRAEMRGRVRFFVDEPVQGNFQDSDINIALNIAQGLVQLEITQANPDYFNSPTPTTITLAGGQETYSLHLDTNGVCDVLRIKRVEDVSTGYSIMPLDQNEKIMNTGIISPGPASGTPTNFYLIGNYIGFTPKPASTGSVNYWFVPMLPDMASDTDVSQIPRLLHDMLPVKAAIDSFVKDQESITELQSLWNQYMDLLRRTVRDRQTMAPRSVRRVGGSSNSTSSLIADNRI